MVFLIEGEVVDTYGGDYTYRDVWYEVEDNEYFFYERYYGAKLYFDEINKIWFSETFAYKIFNTYKEFDISTF